MLSLRTNTLLIEIWEYIDHPWIQPALNPPQALWTVDLVVYIGDTQASMNTILNLSEKFYTALQPDMKLYFFLTCGFLPDALNSERSAFLSVLWGWVKTIGVNFQFAYEWHCRATLSDHKSYLIILPFCGHCYQTTTNCYQMPSDWRNVLIVIAACLWLPLETF